MLSEIRPDQEIWYKMLAECYGRLGQYENMSIVYKQAVDRFPRSTLCLNSLVQLNRELGLNDKIYEDKLNKLTKLLEKL